MSNKCRKCAVSLSENANWSPSCAKKRDHICRTCGKARDRENYLRNREKISQQKAAYYASKAAAHREYAAEYREANRDEVIRRKREYYHRNRDQISDKRREYVQRNIDAIREHARKWRDENRHKIREYSQRRKARLLGQTPPDADFEKIAALYAMAGRMAERFGEPYEVDHLVPLSKGGLHHQDNLVVMAKRLNRSKAAKIIVGLVAFFGENRAA